jgi:fibronectin type 3 domain-containing protein
VGQSLTADPGSWSGTAPISYAYQWRRCDSGGANCADIAGATAQTYALVSADVGSTMRVAVTGSNGVGSATATSAQTAVVAAAATPPANTSPPTISGTAQAGQTLTADKGTWTGTAPISYAYQWRRCAVAYSNSVLFDSPVAYWRFEEPSGTVATDQTANHSNGTYGGTYTLGQAGAITNGSSLAVRLTGSGNGDIVAPDSTSLKTGDTMTYELWVKLASLPNGTSVANLMTKSTGTGALRIIPSGAVTLRKSGSTDIASSTTTVGADGRYHYIVATKNGASVHIYIDGVDVTGAVSNQTLTNSTESLAIGHYPNSTKDALDGTVDEAAVYNYALTTAQVQRHYAAATAGGCNDIAGATGQTYTPASSDVGQTLRVAVTATNSAGSSSATSVSTAQVLDAPPSNTTPPTISGIASNGNTLAATQGTWTGSPTSFTYQWRRCDSGGGSCANIAAATASTYTLVSADVGNTIRVSVTAANGGGSTTASSQQTSVVSTSGWKDQPYAGAGDDPTASKPESKAWWNDGSWWASMWAGTGNGFHIFKLNTATQAWTDTGTQIDDRKWSRADALWDGTHLYVASHIFSTCGCSTSSPGNPSRVYRYSYNALTGTYTLDVGFPVVINNTSTETLVIDKDSTGALWATWAQDNQVMVTHTVGGNDHIWATPYVVPVSGASNLNPDDIASVVAYGGNKIGIMWSNQNDSAIYFASHTDGQSDTSWTVVAAVRSTLVADDHINLKSLQSDGSGRVFAVTKTSLNDAPNPNPGDPLVLLLVRDPSAGWSLSTVWRIGDTTGPGVTRPILLIDESNSMLHVFATSSDAGGTILEKTSPISSVSFPSGAGATFMTDPSGALLNNATSTKQNVTSASGIMILASNNAASSTASQEFYWHNYEALPGDTSSPTAPAGLATSQTQTTVGLSWNSSSDDVGVRGYGLYLNGTSVGTTQNTSYTFSGLACGRSYTLTVDAYDAAGNRSTKSSLTATTAACTPPCGTSVSPPATYQHVIWIWMENKSYNQVIGSSSAPYINQVAQQCGLATNYSGVTHPSLPNYLAATSGDFYGISDDNPPSSHPLSVSSIYSQVSALGKQWRDYEESSPGTCPQASSYPYGVNHDPAAYYTGIRTDCANWDVPLGSTSGGNLLSDLNANTLPAFAFVTPDLCSDTHDCSVPTGDAWLNTWVPRITSSAAYQSGSTAIFITWDEDDLSSGNHVGTIVISPTTPAGTTSSTAFNHYSLLKTTEDMLGITTYLGHAGDPGTTSMRSDFHF